MQNISFFKNLLTLCLAGVLLIVITVTSAVAQTFESRVEKVSLIELYTSEGCSSCPPADRWLSRLVDHQQLWTAFIPVAMHVTYWDYIGWQDPFASSRNDRRQRLHKTQNHSASVYTPGFFVAGGEWRGWFKQPELKLSDKKVGKLRLQIDHDQVSLSFNPFDEPNAGSDSSLANSTATTAHLVLLGFDLDSEVRSGENRGVVLKHNFVALDHQLRTSAETLRQRDGETYRWKFQPFDLPAKQTLAIVAWVQQANDIKPVQSVGGWLQS